VPGTELPLRAASVLSKAREDRLASLSCWLSESARAPAASASVKAKQRFSEDIVAEFRRSKGLRIRAGTRPHRFIGIWVVVVNDRVFVRSWSIKLRGWYRMFLGEPRGTVKIADREIAVRAVRTRDKRLRDAVDRAYREKYNTRGAITYAKDLGSAKSRATTLELRPFAPISR